MGSRKMKPPKVLARGPKPGLQRPQTGFKVRLFPKRRGPKAGQDHQKRKRGFPV